MAARALCIAALLSLHAGGAWATVALAFGIDEIAGEGWRASDLRIELTSAAAGAAAVDIRVASLTLPDELGTLQGLHFACAHAMRDAGAWRCDQGELKLRESPLQAQATRWQGRVGDDRDWRIEIPGLALGDGRFAVTLSGGPERWQAQLQAHRLELTRLSRLANAAPLPADWGVTGRLSGLLRVQGAADAVSEAYADLLLDRVDYASPDGRQAAEGLVLKVELKTLVKGGLWYFDNSLSWPAGALYSEPVFVDAEQAAPNARVRGHWHPGRERLQVDNWQVVLPGIVDLSGTGRLAGRALRVEDLTLALRSDDAGRLYTTLLQPFLIGTAGDDLAVAGRVGLALHVDGQGIEQAGLDLAGLRVADRKDRFSLADIDGHVAWHRSKSVPVSELRFAGARVYRVPVDAFAVRTLFTGDRVRLVEPLVVPLLDGRLTLSEFALDGALVAGAKPAWTASASLRDLSLDRLTEALGWTPFGGKVAGELRDMRYADGVFTIGGGLALDAFDGDIRVSNLTLRDPLGAVPVLQADAHFRGVSLKSLTRTFSFGLIEGRLDGDIDGLRLIGWQPDRFDLHFYTPADDDSRHRISQRAVENLTELGSGVPAGLSTTVLRLFEQFGYDRIDLRIALRGDVAELDGLAREGGGYYLVKGAGLPRIDVIGRNRSVAWMDLVERLRQIQVEGARIE